MNQREYIRHPVSMPVSVGIGGSARRRGEMRNFCLGGLLLALPDDSRPLLSDIGIGDVLALQFEVEGARGRREVTLPARIVRVEEDALGLAFEQPDTGMLLALQNHVRALLDSGAANRKPSANPAHDRQAVKRVISAVSDFCETALARFFPAARAALEEEADLARSNEAQHPWFEAIKLLSNYAEPLAENFFNRTVAELKALLEGMQSGGTQQQNQEPRLSLVDKSVFEDWLTLKVMASRAENHFHDELLHLQLRFDKLFHISLNTRKNPLSPSVVCNAFGESLRRLAIKEKTDRVILNVFEKQVVDHLGDLYQEVNARLASDGILPDLDVGRYLSQHYGQPQADSKAVRKEPEKATPSDVKSSPVARTEAEKVAQADNVHPISDAAGRQADGAARAEPSRGASRQGGSSSAGAVTDPLGQSGIAVQRFAQEQHIARNAYAAVKKLLAQRNPTSTVMGHAEGTAARVIEPPRVDDMLANLQTSEPTADEVPLADRISEKVSVEAGEDAQLPDDARAAIDVIHHLFAGIIKNPALSQRVRESIRRLEVPFLRLLLHEDRFLHEDSHPARQLLNHMAQLGIRGSRNLNQHEQQIEKTVSHVLENYHGDIEVFSSSLATLEKMAASQKSIYERNIRRVSEACDGEQKLLAARRVVRQELEQRLGGRRIPRAVVSLVDAGWRELLVQTILRSGVGSREWLHFMGVVDRMLEAVQEPPSSDDLAGLLALIKGGLSRVDDSQLKNQRLVGELKSLLSSASREKSAPEMMDLPAGLLRGLVDEDEPTTDASDPRWLRRAQRYDIGDWFRRDDQGEKTMVRVAWVAEDRQRYVFVNHQGMKLLELKLADFAEQLASGAMEHSESQDAPAMDRGLESMVQGIYDQMAHQAIHDDLTGLVTRREFERRLRQRLAEDSATGSLLHFDIDKFELVNSMGGHPAGDAMILAMARLIQKAFPGSLVGRLAGDEFSVWVQPVAAESLVRDAEKFCRAVAGERFNCAGKPYSVTVSCGVSHRHGSESTADELMRTAESACHAAKEAGRNRVQVFSHENRDTAKRHDVMAWVTKLNQALDENRLVLRCQRIEKTDPDGSPPAYEILISVLSEDGEMLAPSEFMHAAERYNRMHAVDRWVIENALQWMHQNPDIVRQVDHISVNLSGHSLNDAGLLEFLFDAFRRYPVPREHLCFEVTETATIASLDDAVDFIEELKNLGCRFSLDDFGSGLASYGQLKNLPVDYIKIDGSFIRDVAEDTPDLALVRSINELGHLMGKQTIAEHVENDEIRACLKDIGIDFVQGYGVEAPRTLESLAGTD